MAGRLKTIKPLIIGIGVAGRRHLEAQLNLGVKTGIYTTNPQTSKSLRGKANIIVFDDLKKGIEWSNLVHVCTPDDKHTKFVALALKKEKAVLCEKPLTTNLKEALYLRDLTNKHNATLIVGQNYRLTPTFMETRKRVLDGSLGIITGIETTYLHDMTEYRLANKWRNNQDFLYVDGSHAVDLACWVVNDKVVSVSAAAGNKIRPEYDSLERYKIILKFASGLIGYIRLDASSARPINGTDLIVDAELGQLISHNKINKLLFYKKGDKKPKSIKFPNTHTLTTTQEVKIIDEYLLGKRNSHWPLPQVDEAVHTIKVLDAIQKAVTLGKTISL